MSSGGTWQDTELSEQTPTAPYLELCPQSGWGGCLAWLVLEEGCGGVGARGFGGPPTCLVGRVTGDWALDEAHCSPGDVGEGPRCAVRLRVNLGVCAWRGPGLLGVTPSKGHADGARREQGV